MVILVFEWTYRCTFYIKTSNMGIGVLATMNRLKPVRHVPPHDEAWVKLQM